MPVLYTYDTHENVIDIALRQIKDQDLPCSAVVVLSTVAQFRRHLNTVEQLLLRNE
jgi:hypothetical protein